MALPPAKQEVGNLGLKLHRVCTPHTLTRPIGRLSEWAHIFAQPLCIDCVHSMCIFWEWPSGATGRAKLARPQPYEQKTTKQKTTTKKQHQDHYRGQKWTAVTQKDIIISIIRFVLYEYTLITDILHTLYWSVLKPVWNNKQERLQNIVDILHGPNWHFNELFFLHMWQWHVAIQYRQVATNDSASSLNYKNIKNIKKTVLEKQWNCLLMLHKSPGTLIV